MEWLAVNLPSSVGCAPIASSMSPEATSACCVNGAGAGAHARAAIVGKNLFMFAIAQIVLT